MQVLPHGLPMVHTLLSFARRLHRGIFSLKVSTLDGAQVRDGAILDNRTGAPETRQPPRQRPRRLTSSVSGRAPTTFPLLKGENNPTATGKNLLQKNP